MNTIQQAYLKGFMKAAEGKLGPVDIYALAAILGGSKPLAATNSLPQKALGDFLSNVKPVLREYPNLTNALAQVQAGSPGTSQAEALKIILPEFLSRTKDSYNYLPASMNILGKGAFNAIAPSLKNIGKVMATSTDAPVSTNIAKALNIDFSRPTHQYDVGKLLSAK